MSRGPVTIREMAVAVVRIEKRPAEEETLLENLEVELVRVPPPLPTFPAPHVPVVLAVG